MGSSGKNAGSPLHQRVRGKPFAPGNPGRPAGARNRTTQAIEALLDGETEAPTRFARRRDRHVPFALPPITCAADAVKASAALVAAVAAGELTPSEAAELGKLIETVLRGIELTDVQDRLARLEVSA
ncbi:hypothetical protein ACRAWG_06200 [Methylobacterium sp. P31]